MKRSFILLFLIFAVLSCVSDPPISGGENRNQGLDKDAPLPLLETLVTGQLDNGLKYYLRENSVPGNRITIRLVVHAGSLLEEDDQLGVAHLVEHMAFNGTENFQKMELVEYLQSVGMSFGRDTNAYTSFDETVYQLNIPADDPEILAKTLLILEDWMHRVTFLPEDVEMERGVVLEEWRGRLGVDTRIREAQNPVLFAGSRYAERSPIGDPEIFANVPVERVKEFYDKWYHPELMSLIVVGDFDMSEMEIEIQENLNFVPERPAPQRENYPVPDKLESVVNIFTDPEVPHLRVELYWKNEVEPFVTENDYRNRIVQALFSRMINNRYQEKLRQPDSALLEAGTGRRQFIRTKEFTVFVGVSKTGDVDQTLRELIEEIERIKRFGFTEEELSREKAALLSLMESLLRQRESFDSVTLAEELVRHVTIDEPVPGIVKEYQLYEKYLPGITLEEMGLFVDQYIGENKKTLLISAPDRMQTELAETQGLLTLLDQAQSWELEPYASEILPEQFMDRPQSPGNFRRVMASDWSDLGVFIYEWDNGARIYLKPTDFKEDEVLFSAHREGGLNALDDESYVSGLLATSYARSSGIASFDSNSVDKILSGRDVSVSPFLSDSSSGFNGSASTQDLELVFQMVNLYYTNPRFSDSAHQGMISRYESILDGRDSDPGQQFADRFFVELYDNHFRERPWDAQRLELWDPASSQNIYSDFFDGVSETSFLVVGDFDYQEVLEMADAYLGNLPSGSGRREIIDRGVRYTSDSRQFTVEAGLEPRVSVRMAYTSPFQYQGDDELLISIMGQILGRRLNEVLREELSGTYSVTAANFLTRIPAPQSLTQILFSSDPQRWEELLVAAKDQVKWLQAGDGLDEYITSERETLIRGFELGLMDNSYWMSGLSKAVIREVSPWTDFRMESVLENLTAENISRLAMEYLKEESLIVGVLEPGAEP